MPRFALTRERANVYRIVVDGMRVADCERVGMASWGVRAAGEWTGIRASSRVEAATRFLGRNGEKWECVG